MRNSKRPLVLGIIGAIVVVVVVGGLLAFNGNGDKAAKPAASPSPTVTGPVVDGGLELLALYGQCGVPRVGSDEIGRSPKGQYCLVKISVKNVNNRPHRFIDSLQKAFTAEGSEANGDTVASVYANGENKSLSQDIAPGAEVTGVVAFDLPAGERIARVQLRGDASSPG
ncbi:MAG: DUF4352 domain-containing protein, partial [Longispora sp.]|nr:DUF4352 domain-containing protein [Longispora sp. (in: high G+C Gram-positive bacteria)]